jgi:hypothetical protein
MSRLLTFAAIVEAPIGLKLLFVPSIVIGSYRRTSKCERERWHRSAAVMSYCAKVLLLAMAVTARLAIGLAQADSGSAPSPSRTELVNQANAPISNLFQVRLQDSYAPAFQGQLRGQGNFFSIAIGMPLPQYRLLPFPQLSLLTIPAAVTLPLPTGSLTGLGDIRFVDIAVIDAGHSLLFGIGPTFVFPTASEPTTGQGKWQVGPAAAAAFASNKWLIGALAQNPISFAGDTHRPAANALILQPFITYQLGRGWFVRSQPQMIFNWETDKQLLPISLGFGRVFKIGPQYVNCFVEPAWNVSHDGPAPRYAITFGFSLLYPDFWGSHANR